MMYYIELAYYKDNQAALCGVRVPATSKPRDVLSSLGLLDWVVSKGYSVGVRGKIISLDASLANGDRLEIYPQLLIDVKEKRRRLVESRKKIIAQRRIDDEKKQY